MREQGSPVWINLVSKQISLTLWGSSAIQPPQSWKSPSCIQNQTAKQMISLFKIIVPYANICISTNLWLNIWLSFFFLYPFCNCFLFLPSDKNTCVFQSIHNRKHASSAYIAHKMSKLLFLHSLIASLKIFIWAESFQIMFSPWFSFVRKVQSWAIRVFLPPGVSAEVFFLGCGPVLMSF